MLRYCRPNGYFCCMLFGSHVEKLVVLTSLRLECDNSCTYFENCLFSAQPCKYTKAAFWDFMCEDVSLVVLTFQLACCNFAVEKGTRCALSLRRSQETQSTLWIFFNCSCFTLMSFSVSFVFHICIMPVNSVYVYVIISRLQLSYGSY
jgi:hypothetical protein